jgi:hypothetical protein
MFAPTPDEPDERSWLRAGWRARNGIDGSVGRHSRLTTYGSSPSVATNFKFRALDPEGLTSPRINASSPSVVSVRGIRMTWEDGMAVMAAAEVISWWWYRLYRGILSFEQDETNGEIARAAGVKVSRSNISPAWPSRGGVSPLNGARMRKVSKDPEVRERVREDSPERPQLPGQYGICGGDWVQGRDESGNRSLFFLEPNAMLLFPFDPSFFPG